jgi:hypothetical protein
MGRKRRAKEKRRGTAVAGTVEPPEPARGPFPQGYHAPSRLAHETILCAVHAACGHDPMFLYGDDCVWVEEREAEAAPLEIEIANLDKFIDGFVPDDSQISLFAQLITGEGDQAAIMAQLMGTMMEAVASFSSADAHNINC